MKKVIEQECKEAIRIEEGLVFDGIKISQHMRGVIYIDKSKAIEVALAICPELASELAEKDKEIERLKRRKLVHQLFIGKVADILSIEKVQELLRESNEFIKSLNK